MKIVDYGQIRLFDQEPATESFLDEVLLGLANPEKSLPSKFFYDARGSELYGQITELEEYYPTRTELKIVREHARTMAEHLGPRIKLVEFGSGTSEKTKILLEALHDPASYVPIDISREQLVLSADRIQTEMPGLVVQPYCADFTQRLELPPQKVSCSRTVAYFPGSTIGNLVPFAAQALLQMIADLVGHDGALVLGVDVFPSLGTGSRQKSVEDLMLAYDDPEGVTAEFNLNLLKRMKREFGAELDVHAYHHQAVFNRVAGRMESYLVSNSDQQIAVGGEVFGLGDGERILTEYSYKYGEAVSITEMAEAAGFLPGAVRQFTDRDGWFAVYIFER